MAAHAPFLAVDPVVRRPGVAEIPLRGGEPDGDIVDIKIILPVVHIGAVRDEAIHHKPVIQKFGVILGDEFHFLPHPAVVERRLFRPPGAESVLARRAVVDVARRLKTHIAVTADLRTEDITLAFLEFRFQRQFPRKFPVQRPEAYSAVAVESEPPDLGVFVHGSVF